MDIFASTKNKLTFNSIQSDLLPATGGFSLDIPEIPANSLNLSRVSDSSPREKYTSSLAQEKKSFTDFVIVHLKTTSTDRTTPTNRFANQNEGSETQQIYMAQESIREYASVPQRMDFSFSNKRGNTNRLTYNSVETQNSNIENNMPERIKQTPEHINRGRQLMMMTGEFKPSNLFRMTEKLSRERSSKKEQKSLPTEPIMETQADNSEEIEPKKTTVNLIDLIKDYTKNPKIEQKIKMNKISFLTNTKKTKQDSNKENQTESSENTTTTTSKTPLQKKSLVRVLGQSNKQTSLNSSFSGTRKTSFEKEYSSVKSRGSFSANKTASTKPKMATQQIRSKSKEACQPLAVDPALYASQPVTSLSSSKRRSRASIKQHNTSLNTSQPVRSSSSSKRGSGVFIKPHNTSLNKEISLAYDVTIIQKEQDHEVCALQETLQKLMAKTDSNKHEIERLRHVREEETVKIEQNKTKLTSLLQQTVNKSGSNTPLLRKKSIDKEDCKSLQKVLFKNEVNSAKKNEKSVKQIVNTLGERNKELEQILNEKTQERDRFQQILSNLQEVQITLTDELKQSGKMEVFTQTSLESSLKGPILISNELLGTNFYKSYFSHNA